MKIKTSSIYRWTEEAYNSGKWRQIVNYGGSRSGKSYSILQFFLVLLMSKPGLKISCWRDIRAVCRATIREDFLNIISSDFSIFKQFTINKNEGTFTHKRTKSVIIFEGCDSKSKVLGMRQSIAFFNEITEIKEEVYDQIVQRTDFTIFADYNPSKRFWLDKYQRNPNTIYFKSTFKHNPFLESGIVNKLLSYDPSNPVNVANGTANNFMWKVYGLGEQAEKPNRVFKDFARCTDQFYRNLDYKEYFGLDFGTANPTAIVGVKYDGDRTFFVRQILYKPGKDMGTTIPDFIASYVPQVPKDGMIVCDSAKMSWVTDMINEGFAAVPAIKGKGSFDRSVSVVQGFNIICTVSSEDLVEENSGYEYKLDRYGIRTDDVVRKDDHLLDAMRYAINYLVKYLGINL